MKYRIVENPTYTSRSQIGIEISPENEPLKFLLSGLRTDSFPNNISKLLCEQGFGIENVWFVFYHQMDLEDKSNFYDEFSREIEEDELLIRFYDVKANYSVIKAKDFEQIFYDYSSKLLEINESNKELPSTWCIEMKQSLEKLKNKLQSPPL